MSRFIASADLRLEHLPERDADWRDFTLGFDGYLHWGSFERCAEIANRTGMQYHRTGTLPPDLDVLRTCLFFERRRERHGGYPPDEATLTYLGRVLDAIRDQVASRG